MKKIIWVSTILFAFSLFSSVVFAADVPSFPSCSNPSGELKVKYASGSHAIIGELSTREGKDEVYWQSNGNALQCFCPNVGDGVQTDWWRVTGISQSDIDKLKTQGWQFVPTGTAWGLMDDPYMARNSSYSCNPSQGGGSTSNSSSDSGIGGAILSFATTGSKTTFLWLIGSGVALVVTGILLRKRYNA